MMHNHEIDVSANYLTHASRFLVVYYTILTASWSENLVWLEWIVLEFLMLLPSCCLTLLRGFALKLCSTRSLTTLYSNGCSIRFFLAWFLVFRSLKPTSSSYNKSLQITAYNGDFFLKSVKKMNTCKAYLTLDIISMPRIKLHSSFKCLDTTSHVTNHRKN